MGAAAGRFDRALRGMDNPTRPSRITVFCVPQQRDDSHVGESDEGKRVENTMTVGEILDALYDAIGCTWVTGSSFVDEVSDWVDHVRECEAQPENDED